MQNFTDQVVVRCRETHVCARRVGAWTLANSGHGEVSRTQAVPQLIRLDPMNGLRLHAKY